MMANNAEKIMCHAPCAYEEYNKKKGDYIILYPDVDCNCHCESCGFNPAEQERRLETGEFKPIYKRVRPDTGTVVMLKDVQQLCFSRI